MEAPAAASKGIEARVEFRSSKPVGHQAENVKKCKVPAKKVEEKVEEIAAAEENYDGGETFAEDYGEEYAEGYAEGHAQWHGEEWEWSEWNQPEIPASQPRDAWTEDLEEEPESEEVLPCQQSDLRSAQRKTLKRGRKPKEDAKAKALARRPSRRDILKKGGKSVKSKPAPQSGDGPKLKRKAHIAEEPEVSQPKLKARKKKPSKENAMPEEKDNHVEKPLDAGSAKVPRVHQDRVDLGSGKWRYEVLEKQVFGCANCRFIYGGCRVCQKSTFRGRSAKDIRREQKEAEEGIKKPVKAGKTKKVAKP